MGLRYWMPLWVVPVLIAMATGTVWLRLTIIRTTYEINQANREIRELHQEREKAELKFTELRSPRRLELLARSRLTLTQPRADQIIHLGTKPTSPRRGVSHGR